MYKGQANKRNVKGHNMVKVHYDMPESEYRSVKALCQSDVKVINTSIQDYLYYINNREKNDTPAKKLGRAYHSAILEGKLHERFAMPLNKDDYLDTAADYKEFAENCGADFKKSWKKDEIKEAILEVSPDAPFFDDALEAETREIIGEEDFKRIEYYMNALSETDLGETLKFAKKEVAVFWTDEHGIPCKARFDAITNEGVFDLKSFVNPLGKPLQKALMGAIVNYRYDIQAKMYCDAYKACFEAGIEGFTNKSPSFYTLFLQSDKGLNMQCKVLSDLSDCSTINNAYWEQANEDISHAKKLFKDHIIDKKPLSHDLTFEPVQDQDFTLYYFTKVRG